MYEDKEGWQRFLNSRFPDNKEVVDELMEAIFGAGDIIAKHDMMVKIVAYIVKLKTCPTCGK